MWLKLSTLRRSLGSPNATLPEVISFVARAQSSPAATKTMNDIARIGKIVCNGGECLKCPRQLLRYATSVTELDVRLLEQIKEDLCKGMDAFDTVELTEPISSTEARVFFILR